MGHAVWATLLTYFGVGMRTLIDNIEKKYLKHNGWRCFLFSMKLLLIFSVQFCLAETRNSVLIPPQMYRSTCDCKACIMRNCLKKFNIN